MECIVVEFKYLDTRENITYIEKFWIDNLNGYVLKSEKYIDDKLIETNIYKIKINCVTDEDLKIPDLKDYKLRTVN